MQSWRSIYDVLGRSVLLGIRSPQLINSSTTTTTTDFESGVAAQIKQLHGDDSTGNRASMNIYQYMAAELQTDDEGNPICIICDEKLAAEHNWLEHIDFERTKLIKKILGLKEQKLLNTSSAAASQGSEQCRSKREYELQRIRLNHQKRLGWSQFIQFRKPADPEAAPFPSLPAKGIAYRNDASQLSINQSSTVAPNCCSTSVAATGASAPTSCSSAAANHYIRDECDAQLSCDNFCRSCERNHEYLIISNGFDHPRCHECFMKLRAQTGVLPLTITSPVDCQSPGAFSDSLLGKSQSPHSPLSLVVEAKKPRME